MLRRSSPSLHPEDALARGAWRRDGPARRVTVAVAIAALTASPAAFADEQQPQPAADPQAPALSDTAAAPAPQPAPEQSEQAVITVKDSRVPRAASATTVTGSELKLRPRLRPSDVVETVPGLFAVQHAGGGKANQYFLRGFDADHGTDVAFFVDDIPVNLPSHGHGQGYADLNLLIPELVTAIDGYKGPYYAQFGDFATAGAVNVRLAEHFDESQASVTVGQYGILRGLVLASRDFGDDWRLLLAGDAYAEDGPFESAEQLRRFNGFARVSHDMGTSTVSLTYMGNSGAWNASGQIPERAVDEGIIGRFGAIDPYEGGATQRHTVSLRADARTHDAEFRATAYATRYAFDLFSDFSFFMNDPVHGDMIEQTDVRSVLGGDARMSYHQHVGGLRLQTTVGMQARGDFIDTGLYHDERRERLSTTVDAGIQESQLGVFAEEQAQITPWLQVTGGARVDRADVQVADRLGASKPAGQNESGTAGATLLSPKAAIVLMPVSALSFFLDFGRGFHSNDARGAARHVDPATLLTPATGYEVGARLRPWQPLTLSAAIFRLDLDSEQVYDGDTGTTEPSGPTTRLGAELGARFGFNRWLFADADATFTKGVYRANAGNGSAIALAPTRTLTAGVGVKAPFGTFGSVRVRHIADRPATEDGTLTAEGWTVVDAQVGHRIGPVELALDAQNVLGAKWREVQFATTSQLKGERAPVREIDFVPGWPRTIMARATVHF